jgi:hypothetical protein
MDAGWRVRSRTGVRKLQCGGWDRFVLKVCTCTVHRYVVYVKMNTE